MIDSQIEEGTAEVAKGNSLKYSRNAKSMQVVVWKSVD
jgi:hypothetical protein